MPGNQRAILEEYSIERGPILAGSAAVAQSVPTEGNLKYQRQYSDGPAYVPATGFYSLLYGSTGLEKAENLRALRSGRPLLRQQAPAIDRRPRPARWRRHQHFELRGPSGGCPGSRRLAGLRHRDRPQDRRDPRPGAVAVVRPQHHLLVEHVGGSELLRATQRGSATADAQPAAGLAEPAGLNLQGGGVRRGAGVRPVHSRLSASGSGGVHASRYIDDHEERLRRRMRAERPGDLEGGAGDLLQHGVRLVGRRAG